MRWPVRPGIAEKGPKQLLTKLIVMTECRAEAGARAALDGVGFLWGITHCVALVAILAQKTSYVNGCARRDLWLLRSR